MKATTLLLIFFIATAFAALKRVPKSTWTQGDFVGPTWQAKSASAKVQQLWDAITSDTRSGTWYSALEMGEILLESMNLTIIKKQDEMPKQGPFDLLTRKKLIHTVGAVAKTAFVPNGTHPYTGGFKGSDNTLVRLSLAKAPSDSDTVPGMAIKFLRDRVPSGNFMAMYKLEGQNSFNFFENNFVNHVPPLSPQADAVLKALRAKFATASKWPEMVGLSHVAMYDEKGNQIQNPVFPFAVTLVPSPAVRNRFPKQKTSQTLEQQLATLDVGTVLYSVFAQSQPTSTTWDNIGNIVLLSKFTSSQFGDRSLFFEHATIEEDLVYRPEWKKFLPTMLGKQ